MTLAEHELVENYYSEQKAAVEAYVERTAKRSKENVWLMLKLFRVYSGHMLNILLPKSQFRFGLGIMSWQDTEQELLWQFLVETKEIMLLLTFLKDSGMPEIKNIFSNVDISKSLRF
jgi:hypothetical protein